MYSFSSSLVWVACQGVPSREVQFAAVSPTCSPGSSPPPSGWMGAAVFAAGSRARGAVRPPCSLTRSQRLVAWATVTSVSVVLSKAGP